MSISSMSELKSALISFSESDSTSASSSRNKKDGNRGAGKGTIIREKQLIEGRLLFNKIQ